LLDSLGDDALSLGLIKLAEALADYSMQPSVMLGSFGIEPRHSTLFDTFKRRHGEVSPYVS
jgi:hypothetical protein